jgi:hypothetical protein
LVSLEKVDDGHSRQISALMPLASGHGTLSRLPAGRGTFEQAFCLPAAQSEHAVLPGLEVRPLAHLSHGVSRCFFFE